LIKMKKVVPQRTSFCGKFHNRGEWEDRGRENQGLKSKQCQKGRITLLDKKKAQPGGGAKKKATSITKPS